MSSDSPVSPHNLGTDVGTGEVPVSSAGAWPPTSRQSSGRPTTGTSAPIMCVMATVAPDPFDEDLQRVLSDPTVIKRLDTIAERRERGQLVTVTHAEVLSRLARRGVRRGRSAPTDATGS